MSSIAEIEIRMRCIEQAVSIAGRQQNHNPETVIAIAKKLCDYVAIGSSPTGSASGEADVKNQPSSETSSTKKASAKSG